jgi:hypothetical protein
MLTDTDIFTIASQSPLTAMLVYPSEDRDVGLIRAAIEDFAWDIIDAYKESLDVKESDKTTHDERVSEIQAMIVSGNII